MEETIADRIKRIRNSKQLSQSDLAKLAKYSDKTAISKIENAGDNITMKQVKRIAIALNVTPAYLMGWDEPEVDVDKEISILIEKTGKSRLATFLDAYSKLPPDEQDDIVDYVIYKSNKDKK